MVHIIGAFLTPNAHVPFVFSTNGPAIAAIEPLHDKSAYKSGDLSSWRSLSSQLCDIYKKCTRESGKEFNYGQWGQPDMNQYAWSTQNEGTCCILYVNDSSSQWLNETIGFTVTNLALNYVASSSSDSKLVRKDNTTIEFSLAPKSDLLLVVEQVDPVQGFQYQISRNNISFS